MNLNRNLHSKTVLTEFARDFEHDSNETVITKLVNKIYEACNNVNTDVTESTPSTSSTTNKNNNHNNSNKLSISQDSEIINQNVEEEDATTPISPNETSSLVSIPSTSKSEISESKNEEINVYQVDASQGRTSLNVVKRISNLITMKDKNLNHYKNSELQKLWIPDDKSRECYDCAAKFTTFRYLKDIIDNINEN